MNRKTTLLLLAFTAIFCTQNVWAENNATTTDTLKILAIGNSFSDDGTDYIDDLAKAAGIPVIIGNLYIGGCSLERHWQNITDEKADYAYRKNKDYIQTNTPNVSIQTALKDEQWDIVTVQQSSPISGIESTYYPYLTQIMAYVKSQLGANTPIAFHQTWAYAQYSDHKGFVNYNNDQSKMYKSITKSVKHAIKHEKIDMVIPSGTAIQNMRGMVGDVLCRDGYHLAYGIGRYTAACTWFSTLFPVSVVGNTFIPEGVSVEDAHKAQQAAQEAVQKPYKVTKTRK